MTRLNALLPKMLAISFKPVEQYFVQPAQKTSPLLWDTKGLRNSTKEHIDALIVIGGNGSLSGAAQFAEAYDVPCIGLPGTIDNDLYGTDATIGYDTTLNTITQCVDKIRDTANSHERIFFVEVMGRDAGFLAQNSAIASGAEAAIIPEDSTDTDQLLTFMQRGIPQEQTQLHCDSQ